MLSNATAPSVCIVVLSALMGQRSLAEVTTLIDNGPVSNRVDVVFLGDGYTAAQIESDYHPHVTNSIEHLFNQEPYRRYSAFFNVHRVDVVSKESGADFPNQGIFRDTALNASYSHKNGPEHSLYVSTFKAYTAMARATEGTPVVGDVRMVSVNDTRFGGGAGVFAVFAAGHRSGNQVAVHEMAHAFNQLADEYGGRGQYTDDEPREVNVTKSPDGEKWAHWIGYEQPGIGVIGVYEGGRTYDRGIYRPSQDSKMRTLGRPFNAVSREKIILDIYNLVDPLDRWLDNDEPLHNPASLWVDVVDPEVITVDWYLDGARLEAHNERLSLTSLGLAPGDYEVKAIAYDATDWVRANRETLQQEITWSVAHYPGDFDGDRLLTASDIDALTSEIRNGAPALSFDLTGEGVVDENDRERWIELAGTLLGDANLDGEVAFKDFLSLSANYGQTGGWNEGNFDQDPIVGFSDFLLLSNAYGQRASSEQAASVPEPSGTVLSALILIGFLVPALHTQRHRKRMRKGYEGIPAIHASPGVTSSQRT